jgi:hypothetical protein
VLGIGLDDRAFAIARDGQLLSVAPAIARRGPGAGTGASGLALLRSRPADVSARHWADIAGDGGGAASAVPLAIAELRHRLAAPDAGDVQAAWLAAGAVYSPRGLAHVLATTQALQIPVAGIVDGAVAAAAPLALTKPALIVEVGLTHTAVTAVECGESIRRRRALVSRAGGLLELYQAWLDLVSEAMVRRTRFDPLHDATTEQRLFLDLPQLAAAAESAGSVEIGFDGPGGEKHTIELARDQFSGAARARYREIERLLLELRRSGAPVAVIVPDTLLALPGLRAHLESLADSELIAVVDGWPAIAASMLAGDAPTSSGTVRLLRRLAPLALAANAPAPLRSMPGTRRAEGPAPTHVLHAGRALPLTADGIVVGRAGNGAAITLSDGTAGVSRRHCTLARLGGRAVLTDHSRHGTWVNGERVAGRVRLAAGDVVRLGEPAVEISLIAVGGGDAAATPD